MSGPKDFRVTVQPQMHVRFLRREQQRIQSMRAETNRLLEQLQRAASQALAVAPSAAAAAVNPVPQLAAALQGVVLPALPKSAAPLAMPAFKDALSRLGRVTGPPARVAEAVRIFQEEVRQVCDAAVETREKEARRESVAEDIKEVLAEMGFAVTEQAETWEGGVREGKERLELAPPRLVAVRGAEQVCVEVGGENFVADWGQGIGLDCHRGAAELSARLSERGLEAEYRGPAGAENLPSHLAQPARDGGLQREA